MYRGTGVYLYLWDGSKKTPERVELSEASSSFCHVVPGGTWQAAEPIDGEVLIGCSVGPGFEYTDYELIKSKSDLIDIIREHRPNFMKYASPMDSIC